MSFTHQGLCWACYVLRWPMQEWYNCLFSSAKRFEKRPGSFSFLCSTTEEAEDSKHKTQARKRLKRLRQMTHVETGTPHLSRRNFFERINSVHRLPALRHPTLCISSLHAIRTQRALDVAKGTFHWLLLQNNRHRRIGYERETIF